ncbi:MAG: geranylgeranyl reductase family protein [Acidobacteria bacterium]|nr:geranylgeranyl reductase family protein [Acidobacteriota bacterium]
MKRVAVLGGGPAGSFAAAALARAGVRTVLIDEKLAWEKPCGGGITYKAWNRWPFLRECSTAKRVVTETFLTASKAGRSRMKLTEPLLIFSRYSLNNLLLERAASAGAEVERDRVCEIARTGSGWLLRTKARTIEADYCVAALGARNPLRQVGTVWTPRDTMHAFGYLVPGTQAHIDVQFLTGLEGYIWVFPRADHLSVGIGAKGAPAAQLRSVLERYMDERGISRQGAQFYGHMLPSLELPSFHRNRVAGDGWIAVGDSAGLVDPITGEGLYYAMRSGELAGEAIAAWAGGAAEDPAASYRQTIQGDFVEDLERGAQLADRVYRGEFLFDTIPERMVQFMRRSRRFHGLMQDLFAGTQGYLTLRHRLFSQLGATLGEIFWNVLAGRKIEMEEAR